MTKQRRNWKRAQANSLQHAMELCIDHAREVLNLSIDSVAELIDANKWTVYKWVAEATLPSGKIRPLEHACGCTFITDYLAASANKLVMTMPRGKKVGAADINELQSSFAIATGLLIKFYDGNADAQTTLDAIRDTLNTLAYHHVNVQKAAAPEFDFGGDSE